MRSRIGQVALSLNLVLTIFVIGSIGLVSYEISRILLARDQLKHCLELCSLAAAAELASTSTVGTAAQQDAQTVGLNLLRMNSILGQPLTASVGQVATISSLAPPIGGVQVYFEFDDPVTKQPVAPGASANVVRVYGAYTYPLFSGGFGAIGVSAYTLTAEALAGVPVVDLVIVYDNSDNNDDQTIVTMVNRYWDPTVPEIAYYIPNVGTPEEGMMFTLTCPQTIGTPLNALPPQNLDAAGNPNLSNCTKEFTEVGNTGNTVPLRGITNTGSPPGDAPPAAGGVGAGGMTVGPGNSGPPENGIYTPPYMFRPKHTFWLQEIAQDIDKIHLEQAAQAWYTPGFDPGKSTYNPWGANPNMFSDMVVNLDGNTHFGGYTAPSGPLSAYPFPRLDYLVEAARGNMENAGLAPSVHTDVQIAGACQPGYQNAYMQLAYAQLQPKTTIESSVVGFMSKLLQTADCHYGFVAFNDRAGTSPSDTETATSVSWAYPAAGNTTYLLPQIPLSLASNNSTTITNILTPPNGFAIPLHGAVKPAPLFVPNGASKLADGLQQAYNQLTGPNARPGSLKAILLVTGKVPTCDMAGNTYTSPATNGPALADAETVATSCHNQGIPIFCVGVPQNDAMVTAMSTQYSDTTGAGLVGIAGSGGTLTMSEWVNPTTTGAALTGNFNNVIRQLLTLVRG